MKKFVVSVLAIGLAFTPAALAQSDLYVSGGYSVLDGDGASLDAFTARGGFFFSENFGAEIEASLGLNSDDVAGAEIELNNQFAGYLVGRLPLSEQFDVLGRVGYTTTDFEASAAGTSASSDVDGFAFGVGGQFMLTEQFGIRGDYTRIEVDDDDLEGGVDVFAISGVFKFGAGS